MNQAFDNGLTRVERVGALGRITAFTSMWNPSWGQPIKLTRIHQASLIMSALSNSFWTHFFLFS